MFLSEEMDIHFEHSFINISLCKGPGAACQQNTDNHQRHSQMRETPDVHVGPWSIPLGGHVTVWV